MTIINGDPQHSDHRPIIIDTHGAAERRRGATRNLMPRFEARWLEEEGCKEVVKEAWEKAVGENRKEVAGAVCGVLKEVFS